MVLNEEKLKQYLEDVQKAVFWIYIILLIIWVNAAPRDSTLDKVIYWIWTFVLVGSVYSWWQYRKKIIEIFTASVQVDPPFIA